MVYDICMTRTTLKVVDNQSGLMIWFGYKKPITSNLILNIELNISLYQLVDYFQVAFFCSNNQGGLTILKLKSARKVSNIIFKFLS